ncbi:MAG: zf-HC2 domain-containing protein [Candidatus Riflebacteria bacterium]|nr:zf-HC2 domain-containing protein [Candidatus Riflebacteria bacterium]
MNSPTNSCRDNFDFQKLLEDALPLSEKIRLEQHLKECPDCTKLFEHYKKLFKGIDESLAPFKEDQPSKDQISRVMTAIYASSTPQGKEIKNTETPLTSVILKIVFPVLFCAVSIFFFTGKAPQAVSNPGNSPKENSSGTQVITEDLRYSYFLAASSSKPLQLLNSPSKMLSHDGMLTPGEIYLVPSDSSLKITGSLGEKFDVSPGSKFLLLNDQLTILSGSYFCNMEKLEKEYKISLPGGKIISNTAKILVNVTSDISEVRLETGNAILKTGKEDFSMTGPSILFVKNDGKVLSSRSENSNTQPPIPSVSSPSTVSGSAINTGNTAPTLNKGF